MTQPGEDIERNDRSREEWAFILAILRIQRIVETRAMTALLLAFAQQQTAIAQAIRGGPLVALNPFALINEAAIAGLDARFRPHLLAAMREVDAISTRLFDVRVPIPATDAASMERVFPSARRADIWRGVNNTTRDRVAKVVQEAVRTGQSEEQLIRRLDQVVRSPARARLIARTEIQRASAFAQVAAFRRYGVTMVHISDGPGCGWVTHDDPDIADGSRRRIQDYWAHPLAHPRCVRVGFPA